MENTFLVQPGHSLADSVSLLGCDRQAIAGKRRDVNDGASILLKTRNRDAIVDLSAITLRVLICMPCRSLKSVSSSSTDEM